ncbi:MAG: hypothetical protein AB7O49_21905 [Sphingomonadales bacterium]
MAASGLASLKVIPHRFDDHRDGFYLCRVAGSGIDADDRNGFATAQVLRALGGGARRILGPAGHDASLDALEACRNAGTGGFRFWPLASRPGWAPDLPDDADDTALFAVLLWKADRIGLDDLRSTACRTVVSHRLADTVRPGPPWPRIGAFKTWIRPGIEPDMADCTVNANVLAMLAAAGLKSVPGYQDAVGMIYDAVLWAAEDAGRAETLSPFYPEPGELALAVEAAAAEGVRELRPVLAAMNASPMWRRLRARSCADEPVICGSPYGLMRWTCPSVGAARRMAGMA